MPPLARYLAVDLGATALRVVEFAADSRPGPSLIALASVELPFDPTKTADLLPSLLQAIPQALASLPTRTREAVLCLGGSAVFSRILKIPAAPAPKVEQMVKFEAQQTVPAIEQALWDHQLLPATGSGEVEAMLVAIKRETVEEILAAAHQAGLRPRGITLAPVALANAFFYNYPEVGECQLILEVGARATNLLLVEEGRIFTRVIPLGGMGITQAVATDLQESFPGAEVLKKAKGFIHPGGSYADSPDAEASRISKLARGVMTRLHTEVERSITYYRSQQGGGKPTRVLLAGGSVVLGYTDLFFQEKLRIPVQFFQPFRRLNVPTGAVPGEVLRNFPAWAVAVGTALQALPTAPVQINVLKKLGGAAGRESREGPAKILAGVAAALLLLLPGLHGFWMGQKNRAQMLPEQARVEQAVETLQRLQGETKQLQQLVETLETATGFQEERRRWPRLLGELQRQARPGMWITRLEELPPAEESPAGPRPPGGAVPNKSPRPSRIEIQGMFETKSKEADAGAVEQFRRSLEASGWLQKVELVERETPLEVDGKTQQVALSFRLRAEWHPEGQGSKAPGEVR